LEPIFSPPDVGTSFRHHYIETKLRHILEPVAHGRPTMFDWFQNVSKFSFNVWWLNLVPTSGGEIRFQSLVVVVKSASKLWWRNLVSKSGNLAAWVDHKNSGKGWYFCMLT
jgi:hypothetical protein